jgi:hypothetical protein
MPGFGGLDFYPELARCFLALLRRVVEDDPEPPALLEERR